MGECINLKVLWCFGEGAGKDYTSAVYLLKNNLSRSWSLPRVLQPCGSIKIFNVIVFNVESKGTCIRFNVLSPEGEKHKHKGRRSLELKIIRVYWMNTQTEWQQINLFLHTRTKWHKKTNKTKTKEGEEGLQYHWDEVFTFLKGYHARGYKTGNNSCSPSQLQRPARVSKV